MMQAVIITEWIYLLSVKNNDYFSPVLMCFNTLTVAALTELTEANGDDRF